MATASRPGARGSITRDRLLEVTADIMLEEGYAAATSRRVAEQAGVQRALVYYYFPTMDDLYLAVLRRGTAINLEAQRRALASGTPLRALWEMTVDPRGTRLMMEFMALGNHRKAIRAELAAGAEQFRQAQVAALTLILREHAAGATLPPDAVSVLIAGIGRVLVIEQTLGITTGHAAVIEIVREYLERFEMPRSHTAPIAPARRSSGDGK
jgi:AcrR family transcriptional regulator